MNEWAERDAINYYDSQYAKINDKSRTEHLYVDIGRSLLNFVVDYLETGKVYEGGVRIHVVWDSLGYDEGNARASVMDGRSGLIRKRAREAFDIDSERAATDFAESVKANGPAAFKIECHSTILNPGRFIARASTGNRRYTFIAEVVVERPITVGVLPENMPRGLYQRPFYKPNLPESTVTEAEGDPEAFRRAHGIAVDLAKSADAGDAEGVFRCFEGLRGVVNRLTP